MYKAVPALFICLCLSKLYSCLPLTNDITRTDGQSFSDNLSSLLQKLGGLENLLMQSPDAGGASGASSPISKAGLDANQEFMVLNCLYGRNPISDCQGLPVVYRKLMAPDFGGLVDGNNNGESVVYGKRDDTLPVFSNGWKRRKRSLLSSRIQEALKRRLMEEAHKTLGSRHRPFVEKYKRQQFQPNGW